MGFGFAGAEADIAHVEGNGNDFVPMVLVLLGLLVVAGQS